MVEEVRLLMARAPRRQTRYRWWAAGLAMVIGVASGCRERVTRFEVINHRGVGDTEHLHEVFDECYYTIAPGGSVEIVARRHAAPDPGEPARDAPAVTQIVHIREVFHAEPGQTYAEQSMINVVVSYAILSDAGGACYEGAGFLSCREKKGKDLLTGCLEQARLQPTRHLGSTGNILQRAELTGELVARRDRKTVVRLLNELNRVFPPPPDYEPPPDRVNPM